MSQRTRVAVASFSVNCFQGESSSLYSQCRSCIDRSTKCEETSSGRCRRCIDQVLTCVMPPRDIVKIAVSRHCHWLYPQSSLILISIHHFSVKFAVTADASVSPLLVPGVSIAPSKGSPVSSHRLPRSSARPDESRTDAALTGQRLTWTMTVNTASTPCSTNPNPVSNPNPIASGLVRLSMSCIEPNITVLRSSSIDRGRQ